MVLIMTTAIYALLLSALLAASGQPPSPVPVYVTSAGAQNGFTDPSKDNRDTVKNLVDDIRDTRELVLVERPEDAEIALTVLRREMSESSTGRNCTIHVKFVAGDIETELVATGKGSMVASSGAWSKAAGKVVDQVVDWVKANRQRLQ